MRFERPLGHERALEGLWRAARERRLAHALCFTGPAGIGKFLAAEWLAFGLVCAQGPGRPCGTCGPCKRLAAGSHPDVFVLDAVAREEEEILVEHVTARSGATGPNITEFLSLLPMEGGWRIVLVREAERATIEAQNALLKTLEEPGDDTLLVLECSRPDRLLPTIHSRCTRVAFAAPGRELTAGFLRGRGVAPEAAHALARWTHGAPGRALALHAQDALALRELVERVLCGTLDPLAAAAELEEHAGEFDGATPAMIARARARVFLDLVLLVLADQRRAAAGIAAESLAHGDLCARLPPVGASTALWRLEQSLAARQDVEANLAPGALCERALCALEPSRASATPRAPRAPRE